MIFLAITLNDIIKKIVLEKNEISSESKKVYFEAIRTLIILLSPFVPHVCDEMWEIIGEAGYLFNEEWPEHDEKLMISDEIAIAVQVNGKLRATVEVDRKIEKSELEKLALAQENVQKHTEGKEIAKIIIVPNKIVNIVVK